jgi:ribonuclease BN (tRNA processing enzyme)
MGIPWHSVIKNAIQIPMSTPSNIIIYPLGTIGWIPSSGFQTTSFAFRWGNELVIIDAGTGLARLLDLRESLFKPFWSGLAGVRIFLTHYHLDHSSGLFWIRGIFGNTPITIFAPGRDIYGRGAQEILDGLFQKPYSPSKIKNFGPSIAIEDINLTGLTINKGPAPLRVGVRHNRNHSDPSVAFRESAAA